VVSDSEGNTYSTGYFSTSAGVNGESLLVQGLTDIFVSKVNVSGGTEWSVSFGGSQSDRGLGITVDNSGNILVCGFYTGIVNFGNDVSLTSNGGQDAFLLKLDETGLPLWAKGIGSIGNSDRANAVAVDSVGNVFLTGQFSGDAGFGTFDLNATDGSIDAFIVKYDANGNDVWVKQGTGESLERGMALATDNQGDVYVTGQFSGDITFDNLYENNVLNAIFLIKYSSEGNEEWIRSAGGTQEAVAYGMTSDGESVFLTGDFGSSISILGGGFPETITSGHARAFFILAFSENGDLNWSSTSGSGTLVSSRAIDYSNGELAVTGYFRCTFDQFSEEYGTGTFNSIGFEDAFAARYSAQNGDFLWARNFGSRTDEQALGITILPDGLDVICGAFTDHLVLPISQALSGPHLSEIAWTNLDYCGDENYGSFRKLDGSNQQDGFLIKVLTDERAPYDYFLRQEGGSCETSVLGPCVYTSPDDIYACPDTSEICLNGSVLFSPMTYNNEIAFDYTYYWTNPDGGTSAQVTTEGMFSALTVSEDGCYTDTDELYVTVAPGVDPALLSDNVVVNDNALDTELVEACQGDTVLIWATYPDSLTGYWQAWNTNINSAQDTLEVTAENHYDVEVTNEFGCTALNSIHVEFDPVAEDTPVDIYFPYESDSISVCENWSSWGVEVYAVVDGTTNLYPNDPYSVEWSVNQNASIGNSSDSYISPVQSGWHVASVTVEPTANACSNIEFTYSDVDSIYIEIMESPEVFIDVTGPTTMCYGDTVVVQIDYSGNLNMTSSVAENFADSAYITSPGTYEFWVDSTGVNGCQGEMSTGHTVSIMSSPQIFTDPPNSVICPNDSVQILSDTEGEFLWQGPLGSVQGDNSLWVQESGLYFAEVTLDDGCVLVSNTIQLTEYSTPFLYSEDGFICQGGTEEIWVVSNSMETIEWLPPLSGNDGSQIVTSPGIYSVEVTGCEITTDISIEILSQEPEVTISLSNPEPVCEGDSVLVIASGDFEEYEWTPQGDGLSQWFDTPGPVSVNAFTDEGCQAMSNTLELTFEPIPPVPTFQFDLPCEGEAMEVLVSTDHEINFLDGPYGAVTSNDSILQIAQLFNDTTIYAYLASAYCNGDTTALDLSPKPFPDIPVPTTDAPVCTGTNLSLEVLNAESGVDYIWLAPNGDVVQGELVNYSIFDLSQEGEYLAYADLENCLSDTVGIDVSLFETIQVNLPPDTSLCFVEGFSIQPDTIFASYLWSDNSTDSIFYPQQEVVDPVFLVTTDFNGCESSDMISVVFVDCLVIVPNIITPNGDGVNDEWTIELDQPSNFRALVYNRSGRKVYESYNHLQNWDGTNASTGEPCPEGVYFYVVQVNDFEGRLIEDQGTLTINRMQ